MKLLERSEGVSLEGIHSSVPVPERGAGFWRTLAAYTGPGFLVAVGYMDPGNWVTSIGGGQQFGYLLLSVVLFSSLLAMLLQAMSAKLGIVSGMDLAQITGRHTPHAARIALWILAELAIMATDVAEIIGGAIALQLLFGLPLVWGVIVTVFDVFLVLLLARVGFRTVEAIVATLVFTILVVFAYEVGVAGPDWGAVMRGFIPKPDILKTGQLTMALGIIGATVMPHNLYLHSALVQSRGFDRTDPEAVGTALRFSRMDSNLQLGAAFIVNCLLLVLGAALFYGSQADLSTLGSLFHALEDPKIAGAVASPVLAILFAVALLASGQNSTITGTLAGQVVMEGFINLHMPMWARRLVTRLTAVIPVLAMTITTHGSQHTLENMLVYSQVFLCLALPFTVLPLVYFTSSRRYMGEHANSRLTAGLGWAAGAVLTVLNVMLVWQVFAAA